MVYRLGLQQFLRPETAVTAKPWHGLWSWAVCHASGQKECHRCGLSTGKKQGAKPSGMTQVYVHVGMYGPPMLGCTVGALQRCE